MLLTKLGVGDELKGYVIRPKILYDVPVLYLTEDNIQNRFISWKEVW